jgi:hypothetical protein
LPNHQINKSANQQISQSTNQPISISANQQISQSAYQPISISANQHISQSAYQPISKSINHQIIKSLLSTAYLPPVQYISKLTRSDVIIEKHENFQKQSYRNRCYIYGANGIQCLVIPVKKLHGTKTPITSVEIDNTSPWQKIHLKSIQSAYQTSPFYEYYADDFNALYDEMPERLFDLNFRLLQYILNQIGINPNIRFTDTFEKIPPDLADFRQSIQPKPRLNKPDENFVPVPYQQVFQERYGFLPNLSIIDLLFNEGPNALQIIQLSIKR